LRLGLPVVLLPMDVTHELVFTPDRRRRALARWGEESGEKLTRMLAAVEHLDRKNFGLDGAVVHDPHVFLYLLAPELYRGERTAAGVNTNGADERHGRLERRESGSPIEIVTALEDAETAFEILLESVAAALDGAGSSVGGM
jgi:inosine-uridine nucleoside N-ribohydrolase